MQDIIPEMQVANQQNLPKRVRYHQANIFADFIEIKDTIIIFICMFDPFKLGLPKYTVTKTFEESPEYVYKDGTDVIYYNAKAYNKLENEKIGKFLNYCATAKPQDDLIEVIHKNVEILKNNEG